MTDPVMSWAVGFATGFFFGARIGWTWAKPRARVIRRPKPPSLAEQALAALAAADGADHPVVATVLTADQHAIIRRALERLQKLENTND